ncbi:glycosyltransferase family 2 protein [Paenibacillus sp. J5C_2022]|uniref:glycosyltransferase family 2 protein n=1 Tax=Paenibacillus sp. J5C2022 TaxID=2977129 RepID=UPI0021D0B4D6|nr:glycosyltransferase family 2 protein [Paenibacillus sp. J5C2022]MCU6708774.1 glycosyltransferase family 2 protein [Paenibacillus sp. J5C2022]
MDTERSFMFTILTATYNRANTLERLYESILLQNYRDFEWLIIDDGSKDNTEIVIREIMEKAPFKIRYYYKENGGKHTALNYAYNLLNSTYVIIMDSDDEMAPGVLWRMGEIWKEIPKEEYERYSDISGRCIDSKTKKIVGRPYPNNINKLLGNKKKRTIVRAAGEKSTCRKTDILVQYPFPEFDDTKFVVESIVWQAIHKNYDQYCVNDIFRVYHQDLPDSLSTGNMHSKQRSTSWYYMSQYYINDNIEAFLYNPKKVLFHFINISRCAILSRKKYPEVIKSLNKTYKKIFVTFGYLISWSWILIFARERYKNVINSDIERRG